MNKAIISVQNLRCNGCKKSITAALAELVGVSKVEVNLDKNEVGFAYQDLKNFDAVVAKLTEMGYPQPGDADSIITKAKSFNNCLIGKLTK